MNNPVPRLLTTAAVPILGGLAPAGTTAFAQEAIPASYRMPRPARAIPQAADEAIEAAEAPAADDGSSWKLLQPFVEDSGLELGGWLQLGWHTDSNDLFNSDPDRLNLHQAWLFVERLADGSQGGVDFGFRFDALYGTDGGDTASFGNPAGSDGDLRGWDAGDNFQTGDGYGFALPQAYVEAASGDWNVKAGHFYTLIGYEVVGAPGNFFYSHAITMYNSEPFTHTGVLASYAVDDDTTVYGGWTLGWDTGFEQFAEGSNFLGGVATNLNDDVALAYMTTIGDFGARGRDAFMQSVVGDVALSDLRNWVLQSDLLQVGSTGEDTLGLNQYLFYDADDDLSLGARFEWWKADVATGYAPHGGTNPASGSVSHYEATFGANYRIGANLTLRPEYRYDWSEGADYNRSVLGMDLIATF